jgi:hypothetical protein
MLVGNAADAADDLYAHFALTLALVQCVCNAPLLSSNLYCCLRIPHETGDHSLTASAAAVRLSSS